MNAKKTIQKILFILMWLTIGAGMLTLLVAAIGKKNRDRCSDYRITINGVQNNFFLDEKDVLQLLTSAGIGNIKGQLISSINLRRLESLLEDNIWVKDAQLYMDNKDVLHIVIHERKPLARIFTTDDNSYYIDAEAVRLPLSEKRSARVPVFTGFPETKYLTKKDSLLLDKVKNAALYIIIDSFWLSQVAQINITEKRNFEMIPTVGNHTVLLGDGGQINNKFNRLYIFYYEILSKVGFDKYPVLDVQYAGQVVATKSGTSKIRVDTLQFNQNVRKLMQQAKQMQNDNAGEVIAKNEKPKINADLLVTPLNEKLSVNSDQKVKETKLQEKITSPQPLKTTLQSKPAELKKNEKKDLPAERQVPKAVMQKKNDK